MRNKETSIGGFADYARNVNRYKKNQRSFQERVEYVKALFEVNTADLSGAGRFRSNTSGRCFGYIQPRVHSSESSVSRPFEICLSFCSFECGIALWSKLFSLCLLSLLVLK